MSTVELDRIVGEEMQRNGVGGQEWIVYVVCICCCILTLLLSLTGWSFRTSSTVDQDTS